MDVAMSAALVAGLLSAAVAAWFVARRFGGWAGLAIPGLVLIIVPALLEIVPLGHAEEAMGRGLVILTIWVPLVVLTLLGAGIGLLMRWQQGRKPRQ